MANNLVILIIIVLGPAFDCISTYIVARKFEGQEQNPFLRRLMKRFGFKALALLFPIEILMIYLMLQIGRVISNIMLFEVMIILAPWIAGAMNIFQFISLSKRRS